jgi:hypothetical protein
MTEITEQIKKTYMKATYSCSYDIAKTRPNELYFDERFWTTKDISVFFDDLCYCDYPVYETVVHRLAESRGMKTQASVVKRIQRWIKEETEWSVSFEKVSAKL